MIFDQDILSNQYEPDNDDLNEELTGFIDAYQQNKNQKNNEKSTETKQKLEQKEQSNKNNKKVQLPRQFQKAKRTLTKIVHDYFIQLKKQYERALLSLQSVKRPQKDNNKNNQISFYLRKEEVSSIIQSISKYVGINYKHKSIMNLKFNYQQQLSKNFSFQSRKGSFSYLPECQKILNLNFKGQLSEIKISSEIKNFKLPDYATPVPFKENIYFLDAALFDKKNKIYKADKNCYRINDKGQISIVQSSRAKQRIKCSIVRDEKYIYLLGGMVGENKIITSSCERFCPKSLLFQEMGSLKLKHSCISACILKNNIWVLSQSGLQKMDKIIGEWQIVKLPWNMKNLPFQFVAPYSDSEFIIFGGMDNGQRGHSVQIYNCDHNWVDVFYDVLPQKISRQKVWGPSTCDSSMVVLSRVTGQNQPDLKQKNNLTQSIYFTVNGVFLNNITTTK